MVELSAKFCLQNKNKVFGLDLLAFSTNFGDLFERKTSHCKNICVLFRRVAKSAKEFESWRK